MSKPDGGAAFPMLTHLNDNSGASTKRYDAFTTGGMSLRDYFAAAALAGNCGFATTDAVSDDQLAEHAYRIADEMLAMRSKP